MKTKLILGLVFWTLPILASTTGAVSGGGGGPLPANPASESAILEAIPAALANLTVYLNNIEDMRSLSPNDPRFSYRLYDKLFADGKNVLDYLPRVQLVINTQEPCR